MAEPRDIPDLESIIDATDAGHLRAFIMKQVRHNTTMEIRLRAHLIDSVDSPESVNKYGQVLGMLVRHNVHGKIRLTKRSLQLLRDICAHFVKLQAQYLQQGEFRNAWEVGNAVISYAHVLMDTYHGADAKLCASLSDCYLHVTKLLQNFPAPELKQKIYASLIEIVSRKQHTIYDLRYNAITCLLWVASDEEEYREISAQVENRVSQSVSAVNTEQLMWHALIWKIPNIQAVAHAHLSAEQIFSIAYLLHAAGETPSLWKMLSTLPAPSGMTTNQATQWARWKFDLALESGNTDKIKTSGWQLIALDQDANTYHKLKAALSPSMRPITLPREGISNPLRCAIYAEERQWAALEMLISEHLLLPELTVYSGELIKHSDTARDMVLDVAVAYASQYGGADALDQLSTLIDTLKTQGQDALASSVSRRLINDFPDRFDVLLKQGNKRKKQKYPLDPI